MDETWTLFMLSFAMLIGCYLSGSIPLAMTLSEERLKSVTVLGAGLLVGTALAVIIPEGVHAMYSAAGNHAPPVRKFVNTQEFSSASHHHEASVDEAHEGHHHEGGSEMHSWIGASLVIGFVFMLLVDQLGGSSHHHSSSDAENGGASTRGKNTATLGLVVHAAADGIALGAAANTSQTHVEMIVFVAIMLHKAPAAFGLVSFLLHEGLDRTRIRKHLAVFSAAAPLLAVITYFCLSQSNKETLSDMNATGLAMLFSAGTFLYVATVHILPELASMGTPTRITQADGTVLIREHKGFTKCELLLMVTGAFFPLGLSFGHSH